MICAESGPFLTGECTSFLRLLSRSCSKLLFECKLSDCVVSIMTKCSAVCDLTCLDWTVNLCFSRRNSGLTDANFECRDIYFKDLLMKVYMFLMLVVFMNLLCVRPCHRSFVTCISRQTLASGVGLTATICVADCRIAMLSKTYEDVEAKAFLQWRLLLAQTTMEFYENVQHVSELAPFNLVTLPFSICIRILQVRRHLSLEFRQAMC
eukprot:COSAG02_NODE_6427_length_3576_cov_1.716422_1_plen_208_part_00